MRLKTAFTLGLLLAFAVAGCGKGDGSDGIATAGDGKRPAAASATPDGLTDSERMLKYAQCMRDNGVTNFPDPEAGEGGVRMTLPEGTDPEKVDAAQQKCKQYLPNGGEPMKADPERLEQMRQFAKCMRDNGVPKFPDPGDDGGIQIDGNKLDIDPRSDEFKAAEQKCAQFRPTPPSGAPGGGSSQTRSDG